MTFAEDVQSLTKRLAEAPFVKVGEWQAIRDTALPMMDTIELEDITIHVEIPQEIDEWARAIGPNLPWAEEHFGERISGIPFNPPPSHVRWPFAQRDNAQHVHDQRFSHTYPERIWPKFASDGFSMASNRGIRFPYGDLNDLIAILKRNPQTRQAYLPIWFPEDLAAAVDGERVPCTLGYHFMVREGKLKITYYIRSCDFYRHFRDDVYMAGRLAQYVAAAIGAEPSKLVMHIASLHIFAAERSRVVQEAANVG